jgi:type I restriction enzyme S subunit
MEVKPGYKQTEVGVIPEDWEVKSVHEFAGIKTGPFGTLLKASEYSEGDGVPLISVGEIREGFLRITDDTPRVSEAVTRRLPQYVLRKGDIVFGRKGGVERSALIREPQEGWFLGSDGISIRPSQDCHDEYLALQFQSSRVQGCLLQNAIGTTMPSLNQEILRNVAIPLPPTKGEQEAIAEALSDADALIESLEQLLTKKRQLKQGAMQELLTGKKRLPGFSGEWETRPFDGVLSRVNAKAHQIQTSDYQATGRYPVVDQGKELVIGFSDRHDKRFQCPEGGVIVFGDHTCIVKFVDFDFLVGADGTQVLEAKSGQSTRFQALQLQHRGISPTGYNRHFKFLKEREFVAPPLPEQTAIAAVLSDMDAEIGALKERVSKARDVKQGMMQELLTGRIRLI